MGEPPVQDVTDTLFSVVIPVFNSEQIVANTIQQVLAFFDSKSWRAEVILVNDGSSDHSWDVISRAARKDDRVIAVNLLKNYGQHNANLCGLRIARGDFVVTLDDDLQNPPDEIEHLVRAAQEGHDVVFGRFVKKKAPWYRSLGSKAIGTINRRVFEQPDDLTVSNFRILDRRVVDRICESRNAFPYITGQALLYSSHPTNVDVRHEERAVGKSGYGLVRITRLVLRILFSYSLAPLRAVAGLGAVIAAASLLFGVVIGVRGVVSGSGVEGWTSTVTLVAFLGGTIILMLAMIGEYMIRILQQVTEIQPYHIRETVNIEGHRDPP